MSFFEFPRTRTYDSDLGWLIKAMEELLNEYNDLITWKAQHESEYSDLLIRVNSLEASVNGFINEINQRFTQLENELETEIYTQIQAALAQLNLELGDMRAQIVTLRTDLTRAILDLNGRIDSEDTLIREYIEERLQEFINSIPDLTTINVYNPVKGYITSVQEAINDLYNSARSEALTAIEYDSMGLTASEYDALQLTAIEYDNWGKTLIYNAGYYYNPNHYMISPFTGEMVRLEVVINELASLHKTDALTATEYDVKDLTAAYYDALDLTAYDYDWNGKTLVA